MDQIVTLKRVQASMIKAAFEEGWNEAHSRDCTYHPELLQEDWKNSQAKILHDKLLMEIGNVKT